MTLRIGILGAARVATYALIDAARHVENVEVSAVAARDPARAQAYAAKHDIAHALDNYAALIASADVDAVYNALPPSLHASLSIAALDAGKPVLCEKPFALNLADVDAMLAVEARSGLVIMEAQHSHYHPLSARMRQIVRDGTLGRIVRADARFAVPVADSGHELRYIRDVGGGALWDLGVYPAYWLRRVLGDPLRIVSAERRLHMNGADIATRAEFVSASGASATLACDMQADPVASLNVAGTHGTLAIDNPIAPQRGSRFVLTVDGVAIEEQFTTRPTYAYQLEAFRDAVVSGKTLPTRGADTRATIELLTAVNDWGR